MRTRTIQTMTASALLVGGATILVPACVSVPSDLAPGVCISNCNHSVDYGLQPCLGDVGGGCPEVDDCWDNLDVCFDEANECTKLCSGCEDDGTCENEDDCSDDCSDDVNSCTDLLRFCVDVQRACIKVDTVKSKQCLSDFVDCSAECLSEATRKFKEI